MTLNSGVGGGSAKEVGQETNMSDLTLYFGELRINGRQGGNLTETLKHHFIPNDCCT